MATTTFYYSTNPKLITTMSLIASVTARALDILEEEYATAWDFHTGGDEYFDSQEWADYQSEYPNSSDMWYAECKRKAFVDAATSVRDYVMKEDKLSLPNRVRIIETITNLDFYNPRHWQW